MRTAAIMRTINIHEAKTHLSRLVEEVAAGEEVILAKAGRPMVRLVPLNTPKALKIGLLEGRLTIPDDFDAPLSEDMLRSFESAYTCIR